MDELERMPEVPGKIIELVDGEVVEVPGSSLLHSAIVAMLYEWLAAFVRERDLGMVFPDGAGYALSEPYLVRVPDVSFVSWDRLPADGPEEGYARFAPDLAVEVVSPGDQAEEVRRKVQEYLNAGTRLVWVLWPKLRSVSAYSTGGLTHEMGPDDELDGGEVLPGFKVRVGSLFDVPRRQS